MRHSRNIPALSAAECAALRGKTVAVIGCGGLGGYLIEYFTRIGIGALRCVDGDCFEESNLNRQLLSEVSNLGMNKAEAALRRIRAIDPEVRAEAYPIFLDAENAAQLISGCDAVVDALDGIEARRILARACKAASIPYVYGAISGWVAQAAVCMPEDELIDKLYPEEVHLCDKSALSFTPALCAAMQAALCVRLLAGRDVQSGKLHYADLLYGEYEQILLK
ncbi:MAG: HesA/MoeB/ThiF family protein [Oscillospiraceae bacterium]|nr:HesA/MoeB/ThiF family protein [Oscillospiraceae bacterium]